MTMRWDGQTTLRSLLFKKQLGGMGKPLVRSLVLKWLWGGMGKPHLEVSYSSDYVVGWANDT